MCGLGVGVTTDSKVTREACGCSQSPFMPHPLYHQISDMALFLVISGFFRQQLPCHPVLVGQGDSCTSGVRRLLLLSDFESLSREPYSIII